MCKWLKINQLHILNLFYITKFKESSHYNPARKMLELKFVNNTFTKLIERDEKEMYNFGGSQKDVYISKPDGEKVFTLRFHPYREALAAIYSKEEPTIQNFPPELKELLHAHYEQLLIMAEKPSIWEVKPTESYGLELFGKSFYMSSGDSLTSTDESIVMVFATSEGRPQPYLIVNGEEVPTKLRDKGLSTDGMYFDIWELTEGVGVALAHTNTMLPTRLLQVITPMTKEGVETRGVFNIEGSVEQEYYDEDTREFVEECIQTEVTWNIPHL